VSGADAFLLWDTYGFPLDLTQLMAEEAGLRVDGAGFEAAMDEAREKSRAAGKKAAVRARGGRGRGRCASRPPVHAGCGVSAAPRGAKAGRPRARGPRLASLAASERGPRERVAPAPGPAPP
jgi:hypothetical protein